MNQENNSPSEPPAQAPPVKLSERQLAQRRDAAKKSTGPRTAKGKDRSKLNAMRHGLYAQDIVNPVLDDPADVARFGALRGALLDDLKPEGILERLLVEEIAGCFWRLKRALRSESRQAWVAEERERTGPGLHAQAANLVPHMLAGEGWSKMQMDLLEERAHERGERNAALEEAGLDRTLMAPGQDAILRFESTVKRHLYRALNTLMRLQKARRQAAAPPPEQGRKIGRGAEAKTTDALPVTSGQALAGAKKPGEHPAQPAGAVSSEGTQAEACATEIKFDGTNRPINRPLDGNPLRYPGDIWNGPWPILRSSDSPLPVVDEPTLGDARELGERMCHELAVGHDVPHVPSQGYHLVGDQPAMASPPQPL